MSKLRFQQRQQRLVRFLRGTLGPEVRAPAEDVVVEPAPSNVPALPPGPAPSPG